MGNILDELLDEEERERYDIQRSINTGVAWMLEGSAGRIAMDYINAGACVLAEVPMKDYWGNRIPSRYEVEPGTKGSIEYAREKGWEPFL